MKSQNVLATFLILAIILGSTSAIGQVRGRSTSNLVPTPSRALPGAGASATVVPLGATSPKGMSVQFMLSWEVEIRSRWGSHSIVRTAVVSGRWTSSNPSVATVNGWGLAMANGVGVTTISFGSSSTTLVVTPPAVLSLNVTPSQFTLPSGLARNFAAVGTMTDGTVQDVTASVTWSSSNNWVAVVDGNGLASARAAGTVQVNASAGSVHGSATLTVVDHQPGNLYLSNTASNMDGSIQGYVRNYSITSNGQVSLAQTKAYNWAMPHVAVGASQHWLYMTDSYHNVLTVMALDPVSGNIGDIQASAATQDYPEALTVDPAEHFVYAANRHANTVSAFAIHIDNGVSPATVTLSELPGSPYAAGLTPTAMAVDPSGHYLYVTAANFDGDAPTISIFTIDNQSGQPTLAGQVNASGAYPCAVSIDATGRFLYTANQYSGDVSAYAIGANGSLQPITASPFAAVYSPYSISADPSGRFLYVANFDQGDAGTQKQGSISAYSIDSNTGVLTSIGTYQSGDYTSLVLVDPSGRYLYAVANGSGTGNGVILFAIDPSSGVLTLLNSTAIEGHPLSGAMTSR